MCPLYRIGCADIWQLSEEGWVCYRYVWASAYLQDAYNLGRGVGSYAPHLSFWWP